MSQQIISYGHSVGKLGTPITIRGFGLKVLTLLGVTTLCRFIVLVIVMSPSDTDGLSLEIRKFGFRSERLQDKTRDI